MNIGTISDFNFKQNILGTIKSDISSYVTQKASINNSNIYLIFQTLLNCLLVCIHKSYLLQTGLVRWIILIESIKQYEKNIEFADQNDTVEWTDTYITNIIPYLIFEIVVCIYGQYEISNIGRYIVSLIVQIYLYFILNQYQLEKTRNETW
ncbi:unnamed protein product [Paramecium pentaurelia]|uniref:Transmembrane protein n=1 Tax=Paramecium pentaurelia TaxID=43138 RepID=A0A8S1VXK3_9CILI|nr:unnamed protein product [Paramecium pentaurelia]